MKKKDFDYIEKVGLDKIREHAKDFVRERLAPAYIPNDGAQTPTRGHPVFISQHACACCCRGCLNKWYKVPKNTELSTQSQAKIVNLLMAWIKKEIESNREKAAE